MANTAFYGVLTIKHLDGTTESDRFYNTDTSLVFCTWASNGNSNFYTVAKDGYITDITINLAATDTTTYMKLYINQKDTGIKFLEGQCFVALNTHYPNQAPIPVKAGQTLMLQAMT